MRIHAIRFDPIRHSETNAAAYSHTVARSAGPHARFCVSSSLISPVTLLRLGVIGILPVLLGLIVLVLPYTSEALS